MFTTVTEEAYYRELRLIKSKINKIIEERDNSKKKNLIYYRDKIEAYNRQITEIEEKLWILRQ